MTPRYCSKYSGLFTVSKRSVLNNNLQVIAQSRLNFHPKIIVKRLREFFVYYMHRQKKESRIFQTATIVTIESLKTENKIRLESLYGFILEQHTLHTIQFVFIFQRYFLV